MAPGFKMFLLRCGKRDGQAMEASFRVKQLSFIFLNKLTILQFHTIPPIFPTGLKWREKLGAPKSVMLTQEWRRFLLRSPLRVSYQQNCRQSSRLLSN